MLIEPPSETVLHGTFERVLKGILDGSYESAPECNGLDEQTRAALNALADATRRRASKILAARTEFVRQLDGTHREQTQAHQAAVLMRLMPKHLVP
jgi:hypothetical protein